MMSFILSTLYVLVCFAMMLVVYLQQGKGGDIAAAFGGGSSQAAFGARSGATVLSRATTVCAILFMVGALALGIVGRRGPASVVGGRAPGNQAPATAPVAPPPASTAPASTAPPASAAPAPAETPVAPASTPNPAPAQTPAQ